MDSVTDTNSPLPPKLGPRYQGWAGKMLQLATVSTAHCCIEGNERESFLMPKITAIIHTKNDARRIGRALESLRPCDEVLVVDHGSEDDTQKIVREHGANLKTGVPGVSNGTYLVDARNDWILCLLPNESLTESLEASLFEWKEKDPDDIAGFSIEVREETDKGWKNCGTHTRLVNRNKINWIADLPPDEPSAGKLAGEVLRFKNP